MKIFLAALGVSVLILSNSALADSIPIGAGGGILDISNLPGVLVGVTPSCISWNSTAMGCSTGTGVMDSVSGSDSADFTFPSDGTIKNIPSGTTSITDFETVMSPLPGGVVDFNLTAVSIPGAFGNCTSSATNNSCNPGGGSPFVLFENASNEVTISFSVLEIAYTGLSSNGSTPYDAVFTTQLSGNLPAMAGNPYAGTPDNIPDILDYFAAGGTISSTWSATESPLGVPEPFSFVLLGSGLVGLSLVRHRRARSRS